jgi:hypothetical protein
VKRLLILAALTAASAAAAEPLDILTAHDALVRQQDRLAAKALFAMLEDSRALCAADPTDDNCERQDRAEIAFTMFKHAREQRNQLRQDVFDMTSHATYLLDTYAHEQGGPQ